MVNPVAGRGRSARVGALAARRLRAEGLPVDELVPTSAAEAEQLLRRLARSGGPTPGAVLVVGGDGSVHAAVNALAGSPLALGLVPAGSGNDAARALGVPLDPARALDSTLRALRSGSGRHVDLARVDLAPVDLARVAASDGAQAEPARPRRYLTVLAAGLDARVNGRATRLTWPRGRGRYEAAVLAELASRNPLSCSYQLDRDGEQVETDALLIAVGNGPSYGGGMHVAAGARPDDGVLDVVVVAPMPRAAALRLFPRIYAGGHLRHPRVSCQPARRVVIAGPQLTAYADGEPVGALPLSVTVEPAALRVLGRPARTPP